MSTASYRDIVRTEIATETLNYAQALVMDRVYQVRDTDPAMAEELRAKARKIHGLRASLRTDEQDAVRAVIEEWSPRIRDEELFWREL